MLTDIHTYARKGLEAELARLDAERERVRTLLASLGRKPSSPDAEAAPAAKRPHQMSDAGRQAIREAVKRRWERVRAAAAAGSGHNADGRAERTPGAPQQKRARREGGSRKK